jgi:(1->4)-alpha-D-glucan 1-alpha-D-glucosylmutase
MNASSTHDTKRSEDVRIRINVLSELHDEWEKALYRWSRMNASRIGPDANEQVLIYQSMLGAWPIDPERMKQYITKALREGKTHTNWIETNRAYEARVLSFIDRLYANNAFLKDFMRLQEKVAYFGALSSLSQLVLKIASPGVPDFYRGTDLWDFSLADPDNRRPVDFAHRVETLRRLNDEADPAKLLKNWRDGHIKMYMTWKGLQFRRSHADLFREGEYVPLGVTGAKSAHVVAFARRNHDKWCVVVVPRLMAGLTRSGTPPLGEKVWSDTLVEHPPDAPAHWTNVLTGEAISSPLWPAKLFSTLPFALLAADYADYTD